MKALDQIGIVIETKLCGSFSVGTASAFGSDLKKRSKQRFVGVGAHENAGVVLVQQAMGMGFHSIKRRQRLRMGVNRVSRRRGVKEKNNAPYEHRRQRSPGDEFF